MIQSDDDIEATQSQMKLVVSEWKYLIIIMGGCLAPDKSVCYLVGYEWRRGKWKGMNPRKYKIWKLPMKQEKISSPISQSK